jgi:hypothetical protein
MFGRFSKKKDINTIEAIDTAPKINRPRIIYFNASDEDIQYLEKCPFNIEFSSLGNKIKLKNDINSGTYCLLNHKIPPNLHEFDIIVIDLCNTTVKDFNQIEHTREYISREEESYIFCFYPQNVFYPVPFSGSQLKHTLEEMSKKKTIVVVFSYEIEETVYNLARKTARGAELIREYKFNNYSFSPIGVLIEKEKYGTLLNLNDRLTGSILGNILDKHLEKSKYHLIFKKREILEKNEYIEDPNFLPLIFNNDKEIVSFAQIFNKQELYFLPNIANKGNLLTDLISEHFPDRAPELFPFSQMHQWKKEKRYYLPNYEQLLLQKDQIEIKYKESLENINKKIEENEKTYSFLNDILTKTGDGLVHSTAIFLSSIGFRDIKNMDEIQPENKEEDLQIAFNDRLVIMEIKGIGGMPTDADCLQILKIKLRRCEYLKNFDIDAVFLLNHQRHLPPHDRESIPFSQNQISDAKINKICLLTTLDLYKIYGLINSEIVTREEVYTIFSTSGVFNLEKIGIFYLGTANDVLKNNRVIILNLKNASISIHEYLFSEYNNQYQKLKIISIQINDKNVNEAKDCEVGIMVDKPVIRKSKIFKKANCNVSDLQNNTLQSNEVS